MNPEVLCNKDGLVMKTNFLNQQGRSRNTRTTTCVFCVGGTSALAQVPLQKSSKSGGNSLCPCWRIEAHSRLAALHRLLLTSHLAGLWASQHAPWCSSPTATDRAGAEWWVYSAEVCSEVQTAKEVCSDIMLWRSSIRKSLLRIGKRKISADRREITRN